MNPELSLCEHLRSPALAALPIEPMDVLEWYDGPVVAVVRCELCGAAGLAVMLDWSVGHDVRVYGLAAFEADALALFLRNRDRGSCDAGRLERELHALLSAAGPAERLVALDVDTRELRAVAPYPRTAGLPVEPWDERLPREEDDVWFRQLGLAKSSPPAHSENG